MKLSELDCENIVGKLENEKHGRWKALKFEVHGMGRQALFFFLIEDPSLIGEVVALFQRVATNELKQFQETEVELSFVEIRKKKNVVWDVVDNDEIRGHLPARAWGEYPQQFDLGEYELFAEYMR